MLGVVLTAVGLQCMLRLRFMVCGLVWLGTVLSKNSVFECSAISLRKAGCYLIFLVVPSNEDDVMIGPAFGQDDWSRQIFIFNEACTLPMIIQISLFCLWHFSLVRICWVSMITISAEHSAYALRLRPMTCPTFDCTSPAQTAYNSW